MPKLIHPWVTHMGSCTSLSGSHICARLTPTRAPASRSQPRLGLFKWRGAEKRHVCNPLSMRQSMPTDHTVLVELYRAPLSTSLFSTNVAAAAAASCAPRGRYHNPERKTCSARMPTRFFYNYFFNRGETATTKLAHGPAASSHRHPVIA